MKYLLYGEWNPEDSDKAVEKFKKIPAVREKFPELFPKILTGAYNFVGQTKGFAVYETDNPEQLQNLATYYMPYMKIKWIPIIDSGKAVELYEQVKSV